MKIEYQVGEVVMFFIKNGRVSAMARGELTPELLLNDAFYGQIVSKNKAEMTIRYDHGIVLVSQNEYKNLFKVTAETTKKESVPIPTLSF